jgi:rubrerythrin
MTDLKLLQRCRMRERVQAHFYRSLAAEAEERGEDEISERLNGLHADEQHHLSRLTARILELGAVPDDLAGVEQVPVHFDEWAEVARRREEDEVSGYEEILANVIDTETRRIVEEILESELHHRKELGGKWMPA